MKRAAYAAVVTLTVILGASAPALAEETATGVVANVDVERGVVILRNGTAWQVGRDTFIQLHDQLGMTRPLALGQLSPGSTVTLRNVQSESGYASPRTDTTPGSAGPRPGLH
jgi:hypothetical protein